MSKKTTQVPILAIENQNIPGLHIRNLEKERSQLPLRTLHRDDYFIFVLQTSGKTYLEIDFFECVLYPGCICYILPGSVHQLISTNNSKGWLLAVSSELIDEPFRSILLEGSAGLSIDIPPNLAPQLDSILAVIYQQSLLKERNTFSVMNHLVSAFTGIFSTNFSYHIRPNYSDRNAIIVAEFKLLLRKHYRVQKSPSWYASQLNLSTSYLNECFKSATGSTVSKWIQKEIVLEGKRLLAYTQHSTKEIAYNLGFDDPAYFNRIFFNLTGMRPSAFRNNYHK